MLCLEIECLQDTMVNNGLGHEINFFWYMEMRKMHFRPLMHFLRRSKTLNMLRFWLTTFHIILHDIYSISVYFEIFNACSPFIHVCQIPLVLTLLLHFNLINVAGIKGSIYLYLP